jgi:hypothetical protein
LLQQRYDYRAVTEMLTGSLAFASSTDRIEAAMVFLQVALNGARQHNAVPKSPEAIGRDAGASIGAGAHAVHVHAYDHAGNETLDAAACGATQSRPELPELDAVNQERRASRRSMWWRR